MLYSVVVNVNASSDFLMDKSCRCILRCSSDSFSVVINFSRSVLPTWYVLPFIRHWLSIQPLCASAVCPDMVPYAFALLFTQPDPIAGDRDIKENSGDLPHRAGSPFLVSFFVTYDAVYEMVASLASPT